MENQEEKDKKILKDFFKDVNDLILFLQRVGLFFKAGIDFGFVNSGGEWTSALAFDGIVFSTLSTLIISIGYILSLLFMVYYLKLIYSKNKIVTIKGKVLWILILVQIVSIGSVIYEGLTCGFIAYSSLAIVCFIFAHSYSLIELEFWLNYVVTFPYTFIRFLSFLAVPIVSTMLTSITEDIDTTSCSAINLPTIDVIAFIPSLVAIGLLLVYYHMQLASIDFYLDSESSNEAMSVYYAIVIYSGFDIMDRVISAIIGKPLDGDAVLETGVVIRHFLYQYGISSFLSFCFAFYNTTKKNMLNIFPRFGLFLLLLMGLLIDQYNVCRDIVVDNINATADLDLTDCTRYLDASIDDIEAIDLSQLEDGEFVPAIIALLISFILMCVWMYYINPCKAFLVLNRYLQVGWVLGSPKSTTTSRHRRAMEYSRN